MEPDLLVLFLSGVLVTGLAVAGLFFLRFWRESRDRLFAYFAIALFVLSAQQILVVMRGPGAAVYGVRLVAFVLILWAIVEKNRSR